MRTPSFLKAVSRLTALGLLFLLAILSLGCATRSVPEGLTPVKNFEVDRYTGRWYEIARLNHRFERDLEKVTAEYTKLPNGNLRVVNRGYNPVKAEWKEVEGVAKFAGDPRVGALKVSFFGPFFASYNVIEVDPEYRYAVVTGPSREYFWILSRTPKLEISVVAELKGKAREWGFAADQLIDVPQE